MDDEHASEAIAFLASLKQGIWLLCIPVWLFGTLERGATAFSHTSVTAFDLIQIFIAGFFLVGWLLLKPKSVSKPLTE